jgi:hypothetical protein
MNWFKNCTNEQEVKTAYRIYAKQNHPDLGGDTATMQEINRQYEAALLGEYFRNGYTEENAWNRWEMDQEIAQKAIELARLSDQLTVEVCGVWLWVTGETKAFKDQLKAMSCRWSPKKLAWYFRREVDGGFHRYRRHLSLQEIRSKYGSARVNEQGSNQDRMAIA